MGIAFLTRSAGIYCFCFLKINHIKLKAVVLNLCSLGTHIYSCDPCGTMLPCTILWYCIFKGR